MQTTYDGAQADYWSNVTCVCFNLSHQTDKTKDKITKVNQPVLKHPLLLCISHLETWLAVHLLTGKL